MLSRRTLGCNDKVSQHREQVETRPGLSHFGEAVQEAEAAQAERLVVKSSTAGMERDRPASAAEGRAEEGSLGAGTTFEDDDADGGDRGASERG